MGGQSVQEIAIRLITSGNSCCTSHEGFAPGDRASLLLIHEPFECSCVELSVLVIDVVLMFNVLCYKSLETFICFANSADSVLPFHLMPEFFYL